MYSLWNVQFFYDHGNKAVAEFECENGWYIMLKRD
jgi:hypothetical protein